MPYVVAIAAGYIYGTFSSDGWTINKIVLVSLSAGGLYYMVKKAGK